MPRSTRDTVNLYCFWFQYFIFNICLCLLIFIDAVFYAFILLHSSLFPLINSHHRVAMPPWSTSTTKQSRYCGCHQSKLRRGRRIINLIINNHNYAYEMKIQMNENERSAGGRGGLRRGHRKSATLRTEPNRKSIPFAAKMQPEGTRGYPRAAFTVFPPRRDRTSFDPQGKG